MAVQIDEGEESMPTSDGDEDHERIIFRPETIENRHDEVVIRIRGTDKGQFIGETAHRLKVVGAGERALGGGLKLAANHQPGIIADSPRRWWSIKKSGKVKTMNNWLNLGFPCEIIGLIEFCRDWVIKGNDWFCHGWRLCEKRWRRVFRKRALRGGDHGALIP